MKTLKNRINSRCKALKMNKVEFADQMGESTQSINNWLVRDRIPGEKVFKAAGILKCNSEWLATGKGDLGFDVISEKNSPNYTATDLMDEILDAIAKHLEQTDDHWSRVEILTEADELFEIYSKSKRRPSISNIIKMIQITHDSSKTRNHKNKTSRE